MNEQEIAKVLREGRELERVIAIHLRRTAYYGDSLSAWRTRELLGEARDMLDRLIRAEGGMER